MPVMRTAPDTPRRCAVCTASLAGLRASRVTCSDPCRRAQNRRNWAAYRERLRAKPKVPVAAQQCHRCRLIRPAADFQNNRARATGLQSYCKDCRREYDARPDQRLKNRLRKHVWYLLHAEEEQARRRRRFLLDREFRERVLAQNRARYHANPQAVIARRRELRQQQRAWEAQDARRCFCGKALPEDRWFCQARCKAACARFVCGLDAAPSPCPPSSR
jgi:predicted nucleic acid-binding Zn ribbon protein